MVALLLNTMVWQPLEFIAANRVREPQTLTSQYSRGFWTDSPTALSPARCITASMGRLRAAASAKS